MIDREKQDIDVMERVLGAAHDIAEGDAGHTEVVDLGVRPWLAGSMTSAVQMRVGGLDGNDQRPGTDRDDEHPRQPGRVRKR